MIEVFEILHHVYDSDVCEGILKLSDNKKTRGYSLKLHAQQSRLDTRKYSFAARVVKPWNSLPEEVVTAPSVQAFEARLDKAWNDQPLKFHYKEDLAFAFVICLLIKRYYHHYNDLYTEDVILRPVNSDDDDDDDDEMSICFTYLLTLLT